MIVYYPSFGQSLVGQMHSYIGDTIRDEFLINPADAPAVLQQIGIRRDVYERTQNEEELKALMFEDINKLKSYLAGPGAVDARFKEEVRNRVNMKFQTSVINGISKQQWQKFTLKTDNINEYEKMKASAPEFKTSALYSSMVFDDENLAITVEASNTVMTLDKYTDDGSVRVANMKGKDNKPMNYSETNLYGNIEANSNWIASDVFVWLKDAGFSSDEMLTERKYEMGAGKQKEPQGEKAPSFKEGRRHAIDILKQDEMVRGQAEDMLREMGLLEGSPSINTEISTGEDNAEDLAEQAAEEQIIQPQQQSDKIITQSNNQESTDIDVLVKNAIEKAVSDKMISETALIKTAEGLFREYTEKLDKFIPQTSSFEMAKQKVWDEFKELRNNPNGVVIEKHLSDFTLQRMFIMSKSIVQVQKEMQLLQQNNTLLRDTLEKTHKEVVARQAEASEAIRELNTAKSDNEGLKTELDQTKETVLGFEKEFEGLAVLVEGLQAEKEELLAFKDENEKLRFDLESKENLITTLNEANLNMSKAQGQIAETLDRLEKDSEKVNAEKTTLQNENAALRETAVALNKKIEELHVNNKALSEEITTSKNENAAPKQSEPVISGVVKAVVAPVVEATEMIVKQPDVTANLDVDSANATLAQGIEDTKKEVTIRLKKPVNRNSLREATKRLTQTGVDLSGSDQK